MSILYGGMEMLAPQDVEIFRWKWQSARFIDCHRLILSKQSVHTFIPKSFVNHMAHFRNFIEQYRSHPFLFGGTLLGQFVCLFFFLNILKENLIFRIFTLIYSGGFDLRR